MSIFPRALVLTAALLIPAATALADNASHKDWPKINGDLKMHKSDQDGDLRATKVDKHNELLGGHGDDVITAGNVGDVIWGDYKPGGQPESQYDQITGGAGKDFIYASHGRNVIHTNGGNDQIHAHFGHGEIFCEGAKPLVWMSHKSRKLYKLHGCTRITYRSSL
jgi:Ca2+-binding RTX toxin-like protein